jgi:hypothetical protein
LGWQAVEDFLEFAVHGQGASLPLLYLKSYEQSLDEDLINTRQKIDKRLMESIARRHVQL